jgi:hypothetical protein
LKIKQRSKKKKRLGKIGLVIIIIIAGIVAAGVYSYYQQKESEDRQWKWITSGPFSINKNQYKLGENVFIAVSGLKPTDVGEMDVVDPKGDTYSAIPFNGTMKNNFTQFFEPNTQRRLALCNDTSLVGHWNIILSGTSYKSIPFEIINEYIPGMSNYSEGLDTVPKGLSPC